MAIKLTKAEKRDPLKVATFYYTRRNDDGTLVSQQDVAEELGIPPPRFGELLKKAWRKNLVRVVITPPESHIDFEKIAKLRIELLRKLRPFSPPLRDKAGHVVRMHKLREVHVIPRMPDFDKLADRHEKSDFMFSLMARICNRAASEALKLIDQLYRDYKKKKLKEPFCGIGWSRTCERIVNLMPLPLASYPELTFCPLIGIIGHQNVPMDAYFLAFRLASSFGGNATKLPLPCILPFDFDLKSISEQTHSIKRAFEDIEKCQVAISGIAAAHYENLEYPSKLVRRQMISKKQHERIMRSGAVAELFCNYFDIDGNHIPHDKIGFLPIGVSAKQMRLIPRFMIVISPEQEKALPAIVSVKAGICSDLCIDTGLAREILDPTNEARFKLRPEDLPPSLNK